MRFPQEIFESMPFSPASGPLCVSSGATCQQISSESAMDGYGGRRPGKCPRRQSRVRWGKRVLALAILCLSAMGGIAPSAEAQTVHFSGAMTTRGSGFNFPQGVAVDASGNIFVADSRNSAVKEILAAGGYTTINTLGSGFSAPYGVAVDGSGNVFVADINNSAVKEILAADGYTTVNTLGSGFTLPVGVAVDGSGNVFVADYGNNAVKEIVAAGGYTTVNTLGSGFSSAFGVAVDGSGNVFVADYGNSAVKEILAAGGYTIINTLGSGFSSPQSVAVDASGNIFVADPGNGAVKEILATGGYTTVNTVGSGFGYPVGVAVDGSGDVFVADQVNSAVMEIMTQGVNFDSAAIGTSAPPTIPLTFTFDTGGTIGAPAVLTQGAAGLDFADAGTGDTCTAGIYAAGATCTLNVSFTPKFSGVRYGAATLTNSSGAVIATAYVYGTGLGPQVTFSPGTQSTLGSGFSFPMGMAVDGSGNVFVADYGNDAVKEILAAGGYTTVKTLGSGFFTPSGVAVDGSGNVFVADHGSNAVKEILAAGGYTTVNTLGSGFNQPYSVAVDGSGNVFVADTDNNAVKEILAAGGYTTVNTLGSGFNQPEGVAVDSSGNVIVADTFNNAVVKMDFSDPPRLSFASTAVGSTSSDSPQTVMLTNIGNAALTFPVPATGLDPSIAAGFTIGDSSTCPQLTSNPSAATLPPGSSCTNLISFTPNAVGSISGSLVTTDNHLNAAAPNYATQSIALSGTGTAGTPTISFTVPNHTYGDAPFTVNATSTSTGAFAYAVVSGPATVAGSTVTLTGAGTVVLQASEAVDANYIASTKNATFHVATITPTIAFNVPNHIYGDAPFTVNATSNSTGAFTYTVVSGPATVSGSTVTLTGAGTVVLSVSQLASGNYASATATTSFTVAAGFTLSSGPGTATVAPGAAATFTLTLSPGGAATYPDALTLSATGLPTGGTATFSPATTAAGSAVTSVTLTIQTSSQTARNEKPYSGGPFTPVAMGFLLLPLAGMKSVRRRLRQVPRLTVALVITILSLGAVLGLSGCGESSSPGATAKSYTVVVTATDVTTTAHSSINLTLNVQ
jgi:sugar lactone lactonase YvrE